MEAKEFQKLLTEQARLNLIVLTENEKLRALLERIASEPKLWKIGRGGQDSFAGMPPFCRLIAEALKTKQCTAQTAEAPKCNREFIMSAQEAKNSAQIAHFDRVHQQLIKTVQALYVKHVMGRDDIGWDKLSGMMCATLCEAMGDDGFQDWAERKAND